MSNQGRRERPKLEEAEGRNAALLQQIEDGKRADNRKNECNKRKRTDVSTQEDDSSSVQSVSTTEQSESEDDTSAMETSESEIEEAEVVIESKSQIAKRKRKEKREAEERELLAKKEEEKKRERREKEKEQRENGKERIMDSPEFIVYDLSTPKFRKEMDNLNIKASARILPGGLAKVTCKYEDRKVVRDYLEANGKGGKTFTPNHERTGVALVKGIHFDEEEDTVKQYIEAITDAEVHVRRFQNGPPEAITKKLHWWVVTCKNKEEAQALRSIKEFYGGKIFWEPFQSKGAMRCYKCQGWNHQAKNCLSRVKCPRCAKEHQAEECKLPKVTKETVNLKRYTCPNCMVPGHWVNSDCCPHKQRAMRRAAELEERRSGRTQAQQQQERTTRQKVPTAEDFGGFTPVGRKNKPMYAAPQTATQSTSNTWSYADALKNQVSARTETGTGLMMEVEKESNALFGRSLTETFSLFQSFVSKCRAAKDKQSKQMEYFNFMFSLMQNSN